MIAYILELGYDITQFYKNNDPYYWRPKETIVTDTFNFDVDDYPGTMRKHIGCFSDDYDDQIEDCITLHGLLEDLPKWVRASVIQCIIRQKQLNTRSLEKAYNPSPKDEIEAIKYIKRNVEEFGAQITTEEIFRCHQLIQFLNPMYLEPFKAAFERAINKHKPIEFEFELSLTKACVRFIGYDKLKSEYPTLVF